MTGRVQPAATRGKPAAAANTRILRFTIGVAAADLDRAETARDLIVATLEEIGLTSMGVEGHFDVFMFWAEDAQPDFTEYREKTEFVKGLAVNPSTPAKESEK
jgi:hypothetical protein